jgi:hypothetical protein
MKELKFNKKSGGFFIMKELKFNKKSGDFS